MKKILFGINQNTDKKIEEGILNKYKELYNKGFSYSSEYYLSGVKKRLDEENYDVLILHEELEKTNKVTPSFLDRITDKFPDLKIVYLIGSDTEKKHIQILFNLGVYDILFPEDLQVISIAELIEKPRTKKEAKDYMEIDEVEHIKYRENLEEIPEEQLEQILLNIQISNDEDLSEIYDEINRQYNQKQMLFLVTILSEENISRLKKCNNENFNATYRRKQNNEKQYVEIEQTAERKEKIITKIEKQYIRSIPTDYNKIVAFAGSGKTGTTTLINLIAKEFIKNKKKVAVIDLTKNQTMFYMNCWAGEEYTEKERNSLEELNKNNNYPVILGENYSLYCQVDNELKELDFINAIEQIRYDNDIILIDMDISSNYEWLKYGTTGFYIVQDLNILNILKIKEYLKMITRGGVNHKKISLIINKFIECDVTTGDILGMLRDPIPNMEFDTDSNRLDINKEVFVVDFDINNYKSLISSNLFTPSDPEITKETWKQINKICSHIYPLEKNEETRKGLDIGRFFNFGKQKRKGKS